MFTKCLRGNDTNQCIKPNYLYIISGKYIIVLTSNIVKNMISKYEIAQLRYIDASETFKIIFSLCIWNPILSRNHDGNKCGYFSLIRVYFGSSTVKDTTKVTVLLVVFLIALFLGKDTICFLVPLSMCSLISNLYLL